MSHSDAEVARLFHDFDLRIAGRITAVLREFGFSDAHLLERVHVARGIMEDYCHEIIYSKHETMDYTAMREIVIGQVVSLFDGCY